MPYIDLNISKKIDPKKKEAIKSSIGKHIDIIPGKNESLLMLRIEDDASLYFRGEIEDCAFMSVKLFLSAPYEKKGAFAEAVVEDLSKILSIDKKDIYICFDEYNNWVAKGYIK